MSQELSPIKIEVMMSWFLYRNFKLLEPYEGKLSRTVLRGEGGSNPADLPDKAIAKEGMAEYIKYLFKTVRKFFGEAIVVTQEVVQVRQRGRQEVAADSVDQRRALARVQVVERQAARVGGGGGREGAGGSGQQHAGHAHAAAEKLAAMGTVHEGQTD